MIKELGFKKMNLLLSKPDDLNEIIERAYKMIMDIKDKWKSWFYLKVIIIFSIIIFEKGHICKYGFILCLFNN